MCEKSRNHRRYKFTVTKTSATVKILASIQFTLSFRFHSITGSKSVGADFSNTSPSNRGENIDSNTCDPVSRLNSCVGIGANQINHEKDRSVNGNDTVVTTKGTPGEASRENSIGAQ